MQINGSYGLKSNDVRVEPDEGYCQGCNRQSIPIVGIHHDASIPQVVPLGPMIHEVSLYLCKSCIQQIVDICFNPEGYND